MAQQMPIGFVFWVEHPDCTQSHTVYAYSYNEAYAKLEKEVGFNIYGKCRLEKKFCNGQEVCGWNSFDYIR